MLFYWTAHWNWNLEFGTGSVRMIAEWDYKCACLRISVVNINVNKNIKNFDSFSYFGYLHGKQTYIKPIEI